VELQEQSQLKLDNESKERALVGEVISTVALAGQLCRELTVSDHGIDMEIEFKDDDGIATGKKVYLQLKSGDSHVTERKRDGAEIFKIKDQRHIHYWMNQESPVLLVIRNSSGEIRWMEIRELLRTVTRNGKKNVTQIEFHAERFDVMSIRRWRDRLLTGKIATHSRESLLQILSSQSDEVARVNAVCRLAGWQDELVHNTLTKHGESDASAEVRAACGEALSDFWWWQLQTRRWIQDRIALDESPQTRDDLFAALKKARKKLAEVWVARLSNPSDKEKVLETVSGYPALRVFKFRLRNIGPFKDTRDVVLRSGVNVFLGDNAAGKTTLLKCLALAAIGYHAANEVEGNPLGYLRKGTKRGTIEVVFEVIPDPDAMAGESAHIAVGLEITNDSSRFAPIRNMTISLSDADTPNPANTAEPLSARRSKTGSAPFGFVSGYGAVRTFSESQLSVEEGSRKHENEWVMSLFKRDAWLVTPEALSRFIRGDTSNIGEEVPGNFSGEVIDKMRASLMHLFPEVTTFFDEGDNDLQLNGTALRFGELSDGYRSLSALIGHLLRCSLRVRNWNDSPTDIHGIALIDEIDIHLHPTWQIHVVEDLQRAFPNLQLIASTHSPLVVAALERENVFVIRCDETGDLVIDRPELAPQGLGVAGILTSIFGLNSTIDQPTLDKITRRLVLHSKCQQWTNDEKLEYERLSDHLASLGFNREFTDPYFERFVTAMAQHHQATMGKLTASEKRELDEYADELLRSFDQSGNE
jgi:hypothetical protein